LIVGAVLFFILEYEKEEKKGVSRAALSDR